MGIGDQIQVDYNLVCSPWVDVVELIRSQDILIVDDNDKDAADGFLTALDVYTKELVGKTGRGDRAGISLRWALGTLPDDRIFFILFKKHSPDGDSEKIFFWQNLGFPSIGIQRINIHFALSCFFIENIEYSFYHLFIIAFLVLT